MNQVNNFLNRIASPELIKQGIFASATKRRLTNQTYEEYKLHLMGELGEVIDALLKRGHRLQDEWVSDSGKPEGFYAELMDVMILSLCVEQVGMWRCVDSPFPISGRPNNLILDMCKQASMIDAFNPLPHTIVEWIVANHNESAIDKIVDILKRKMEYNEKRRD